MRQEYRIGNLAEIGKHGSLWTVFHESPVLCDAERQRDKQRNGDA